MTEPATHTAPAPTLPAGLRLGAVHLVVRDLDRAVRWYEHALGLRVHAPGELGDGHETVVVLEEDPAAVPAGRHAGLYHYALLYPSREALARAATRLIAKQTHIQGASDHGTHEAIYLPDADGKRIRICRCRCDERSLDQILRASLSLHASRRKCQKERTSDHGLH